MYLFQRIIIFAFVAWLGSGFLGIWIGIDTHSFSQQEMRTPSSLKEISTYSTSKELVSDVEKFWDDRIFLRKYYISLYQFLQLESLTAAFKSSGAHITGQNNWLFLGNTYDSVIDYTKNTDTISALEIQEKIDRLKLLQDIVKQHNIPYAMLIAPNKHSIYTEFLPLWIKPASNFRFADAVSQKALEQNLLISFPKESLLQEKIIAEKEEKRLYGRDDTHWNAYGAFVAFKEMWALLQSQADFPNITQSIRVKQIEKTRIGDLIGMGNYPDSYRDTVGYVSAIDENITKNMSKKRNLLIIGDSFTDELMPLYELAFDKITRLHWNTMSTAKFKELVEEIKPDAVVYQVVERSFRSGGIKE